MLSVDIPNSKEEIKRQIDALNYALKTDKNDKDRQIHQDAINILEKALKD